MKLVFPNNIAQSYSALPDDALPDDVLPDLTTAGFVKTSHYSKQCRSAPSGNQRKLKVLARGWKDAKVPQKRKKPLINQGFS